MSTAYAGNPATFPATVAIPDGGDLFNINGVATAVEGCLDRTAWLAARANDAGDFAYVDDTNTGDEGSDGDPIQIEEYLHSVVGNNWTSSANIFVDVPNCQVGDLLVCSLNIGGVRLVGYTTFDGTAYMHLLARDDQTGTPSVKTVLGARAKLQERADESVAESSTRPVHLMGRHIVTEPGTTRIVLQVRLALVLGTFGVNISSGVYLHVQRFRSP